jgi:hypothetical protein
MTPSQSYVADNAAARERLRTLVARLSDADLALPVGGGWSVALALAHLAFWDTSRLALLRRWLRAGVEPAQSDSESVNAAVEVLGAAIPPRRAAELALAAAEAIDRELESVEPGMAARIEEIGHESVIRRSIHRNEHIDQIERALEARL